METKTGLTGTDRAMVTKSGITVSINLMSHEAGLTRKPGFGEPGA